ncbi:MAG TPA: thiamine ABC transporter substrate-binding protein [Candidatus Thermoplasmatota archaeon]|nr:thiamine ABC transporter substrate-binding protein [Candidatus Thermoplasmatota archaeon]
MKDLTTCCLLLLVMPAIAGCTSTPAPSGSQATYASKGFAGDPTGRDATRWPDLSGETVTILDQGAFDYLFTAAQPLFENLTHAKVRHIAALDAGDVVQRSLRESGDPSFDVLYGIDNVLMAKARDGNVFAPYTPVMGARVNATLLFFDAAQPWPATPVDHGYTAINIDPRAKLGVHGLRDLANPANARQFVTEDPRTSSPGLGFLIATVATFGDKGTGAYDYLAYWDDLLANGTLVTPGWTEAYVQHFTAGYGAATGAADRAIVTSYSTSPAYEAYSGAATTAKVLLAPMGTFHQVETMGIARGTRHLAAAQAWIEFTLTDAYQELQAPQNAVYPVVDTIDVASVFGHADPAPGTFLDADLGTAIIGSNVDRWVREWTEVFERHQA